MPIEVVSGGSSLSGFQIAAFSLHSCHKAGIEGELSRVSSFKDTNPMGSGPHTYDLITS